MKHVLWVMKSRKKFFSNFFSKNFFRIFFSNFQTWISHGYRWIWPMIWVSFESSRPDLEEKRVKSWKSRLFKKKNLRLSKALSSKIDSKYLNTSFWVFVSWASIGTTPWSVITAKFSSSWAMFAIAAQTELIESWNFYQIEGNLPQNFSVIWFEERND